MNLLVAEGLTKEYGNRTIFEDISFGINEGDKIGVIGVNGTGKSTLLRIIAGEEEADSGSVTSRNRLRIAYLPQNPVFDDSMSVLKNVIFNKVALESYHNLEGQAKALLLKFGIENPDAVPSTLSGGQRKRASLVRTMLTEADLMILDEPTNHLDTEMIEWLEESLKDFKGALLLVTHDRYFLDEVTNKIFEVDKRALYSYSTNYSGFIELKSEREASEQATERKAKSLFKTELAWMLRGARARSTKQKAHIQRFEALKNRKKIEETENVEMFSAFSRLGKKTIEVNSISKAYGDKVLIKDFSYIFLQNDRVGIIGPNGCGKSTLIKIITDTIKADSGSLDYGITVKYGYFAQECESMNPDQKVIDYIRDVAEVIHTKEGDITASRMCERFLFNSSLQYSLIGKLSGGERRRLYLLKILMQAPNVLILDEPTNDLDIMTLTILEDYLQSFEGIVIAVSHDRYFLDKLVNRIFVFRGQGRIDQVEGNYTDYREKELDTIQPIKEVPNDSTDKKGKVYVGDKSTPKKFSFKEQREYDTIDAEIAELEAAIEDLESRIGNACSDYFELQKLMKEKEEKEEALEFKMDRWVYLNELAESFTNK